MKTASEGILGNRSGADFDCAGVPQLDSVPEPEVVVEPASSCSTQNPSGAILYSARAIGTERAYFGAADRRDGSKTALQTAVYLRTNQTVDENHQLHCC